MNNKTKDLTTSVNEFFTHVGILGMHWGVHKNRGSTTTHPDSARVSSLRKKKLNEMSNEELKALTTRMQLEKQFKDLRKTDLTEGEKFFQAVAVNIGKNLLTNYATKGATSGIDTIFKMMSKASG